MPTLTIFAGVNGAGKTTLYKYQLAKDYNLKNQFRVNPDEILKDFGGDWRSVKDQYKSGFIAIGKIKTYFKQRVSFNWETTILSYSSLMYVKTAKALNYKVNLYFVSVEDISVAFKRIKMRVEKGGHDVDSKLVENRFNNQFNNLNEILKYVDNAVFFDNTTTIKIVATYVDKHFTYVDDKTKWTQHLLETIKSKN